MGYRKKEERDILFVQQTKGYVRRKNFHNHKKFRARGI